MVPISGRQRLDLTGYERHVYEARSVGTLHSESPMQLATARVRSQSECQDYKEYQQPNRWLYHLFCVAIIVEPVRIALSRSSIDYR